MPNWDTTLDNSNKCERRSGIGQNLPFILIIGKKLAGGAAMEAYKWFMLGMMVAWMPSLLVLALMLRRHHIDNLGQDADATLSRH
jgi:hypothetical protein